ESAYPYRYLRSKCPCATCDEAAPVAEQAVGGLPILGQKPLHPERAELVGRYALQIYWSDGHSSGIYASGWRGNRASTKSIETPRIQRLKLQLRWNRMAFY